MRREQILEILENYKLRIPPTVFYDLKVDIVNEEEFEWCETCKEYDQEKHCCHRWSKVIRNTVEEMKQAYIERDVLDKIRTEIADLDIYYDNDYFCGNNDAMFKCNDVLQIIDKYKAESEGICQI